MMWWEWLLIILLIGFYVVALAVTIKYGRIRND